MRVPPVEIGKYDHSKDKERGQHQQPVDNIGYTFLEIKKKYLVGYLNIQNPLAFTFLLKCIKMTLRETNGVLASIMRQVPMRQSPRIIPLRKVNTAGIIIRGTRM